MCSAESKYNWRGWADWHTRLEYVGNRVIEMPSTFANAMLTWEATTGGIFGIGN